MRTGAGATAEMLEGYGVTHLFHVPAILRNTMVEIERETTIRRVRTHGEKAAAYMADGFARISGRPGLCAAQAVGALNLAAGLRDAHLAHSPVIALTGGRDPRNEHRKVYQENDDLPAFENVTKLNARVDDVNRIPDMLRFAFRAAVSGCPGPVHLQFAGNEGQLDRDPIEAPVWVEAPFRAVPPYRLRCDDHDLLTVLEILRSAERPVIVAGGGVRASGAGPALVRFAELLGIPVATSLNAKDTIPGAHRLSVGVVGTYSRASANEFVRLADVVLFVGSETGSMTTHFWSVPGESARIVQIDVLAENLGRNYLLEVGVVADAQWAIERMTELVEARELRTRHEWLDALQHSRDAWYSEHADLLNSEAVPIRPERVCRDLSDHLPEDAVVVVDTGHAGMWMGGMFDVRFQTQSYVRSAGSLGWAFPASLGAKCAAPERPVVCFTGDSGFWYHVAEIETAVRWSIPTVTVVNNNYSGNQSRPGFDRAYGGTQTIKAQEMWRFTEVDFAALANLVGAIGIRVDRPAAFKPALERAISETAPVVIDVVTDIDAIAPRPA